jgi:hypothetical protein
MFESAFKQFAADVHRKRQSSQLSIIEQSNVSAIVQVGGWIKHGYIYKSGLQINFGNYLERGFATSFKVVILVNNAVPDCVQVKGANEEWSIVDGQVDDYDSNCNCVFDCRSTCSTRVDMWFIAK